MLAGLDTEDPPAIKILTGNFVVDADHLNDGGELALMRLTRGFTYLAAVSLAAGTVIAVAAPHAVAVSDVDNISPANKSVKGTATNFKAIGQINGLPVTVTCTSSTLTATTPATGLGPVTVKPTFTGCRDSFGGTDTVKIFGTWKLTFVDVANDEAQTEPNAGDKLQVTIPKAGATFQSSIVSGCVITVAPTAPFSFSSKYDDVSKSTVNVKLPVSGSGCSSSPTSTTTATYTLSPGIHDVS
jgi:hypothetical protein